MQIQWEYPEPRSGLPGEWDRFIGPGATRAENWLIIASAFLAAGFVLIYDFLGPQRPTALQIVLSTLIAFDLGGGVAANATRAAKRWYHRPGQGRRQHMAFTLVHILYIFLVAWLFRSMDWVYFACFSVFLGAAAWLILSAPLYLQRALTLVFCGLAVMFNVFPLPTPGLEWFIPILFIKLLAGHVLREEPYSPQPARPDWRAGDGGGG